MPTPALTVLDEDRHAWFAGRTRAILAYLDLAFPPDETGIGGARDRLVLDVGSGAGNMAHHLAHYGRVIGLDSNPRPLAVAAQRGLEACRGGGDCLPFADASFDLVYAGSVFTHLSELADAWLLELLRITEPGGLLYLTVHDQGSIEFCRQKDPESLSRALTGFAWPAETEARFRTWSDALGTDLQGFTIGRGYLAQVFYDRDAIVGHWGRYADVVEVVPNAFAFHQTAIVLRCRDDRSG